MGWQREPAIFQLMGASKQELQTVSNFSHFTQSPLQTAEATLHHSIWANFNYEVFLKLTLKEWDFPMIPQWNKLC